MLFINILVIDMQCWQLVTFYLHIVWFLTNNWFYFNNLWIFIRRFIFDFSFVHFCSLLFCCGWLAFASSFITNYNDVHFCNLICVYRDWVQQLRNYWNSTFERSLGWAITSLQHEMLAQITMNIRLALL